jgi:hypothetical protein
LLSVPRPTRNIAIARAVFNRPQPASSLRRSATAALEVWVPRIVPDSNGGVTDPARRRRKSVPAMCQTGAEGAREKPPRNGTASRIRPRHTERTDGRSAVLSAVKRIINPFSVHPYSTRPAPSVKPRQRDSLPEQESSETKTKRVPVVPSRPNLGGQKKRADSWSRTSPRRCLPVHARYYRRCRTGVQPVCRLPKKTGPTLSSGPCLHIVRSSCKEAAERRVNCTVFEPPVRSQKQKPLPLHTLILPRLPPLSRRKKSHPACCPGGRPLSGASLVANSSSGPHANCVSSGGREGPRQVVRIPDSGPAVKFCYRGGFGRSRVDNTKIYSVILGKSGLIRGGQTLFLRMENET